MKQSDKPRYVTHVLGEVVSKKYRHHYYDTPEYVIHVLGGAVSKTYRRLPGSKNYGHVISTLSRAQVVTAKAA